MKILGVLAWGAALSTVAAWGQTAKPDADPVQWSMASDAAKAPPGSAVYLKLTARVASGWHIYSLTPTKDGIPLPTTVALEDSPAVESSKVDQPKPLKHFDSTVGAEVEQFVGETQFLVTANLKKDAAASAVPLTAKVRYQACNDHECKIPKTKTATFSLAVDTAAAAPALVEVAALTANAGAAAEPETPAAATTSAVSNAAVPASSEGLGGFMLGAFGLGLVSVFTPCVFPMIPITVSFFLGQRGGILQAVVFSLGIIALFCALGLGVTAVVGPFGVAQLSSSPWVNGFIAAVIAAFALSLFGAFEITLPSGMLTKLDMASRRGGYFGTLLMGLTFSLTSFACVGPFVGSLLVSAAQSKGPGTVLGMASFATGLASPFFFLAAFPSYLKKMPKSGGWLVRVKVVMGFVLLAFMFKYLSNVDQVLQTGWLTRDRMLAAWFVLLAMPGLYLLGLLRLEGIEASDRLGIGRLLTACGFLILAFSLLPGMFGAKLGLLDAYLPAPAETAASTGGETASGRVAWMRNQYREGLMLAKQQNKLVLVNFSGYACTNCKWMDANVFPRADVQDAMKSLVPVELFIDGTDKASEDNAQFEEQHFKVAAMPYYAVIDPDEKVLATFADRAATPQEFQQFLTFLKTKPGA